MPTETIAPTPTAEPTATAFPTPIPNTDSLIAASSLSPVMLGPGSQQSYAFTYAVTTPRAATTIRAELRAMDGSIASGWSLRGQAGGGSWATEGAAATIVDSSALVLGTSFGITIVIDAPSQVTTEQAVSLFIKSSVSTDQGEVATSVNGTTILTTLTVLPPVTPTPAPTTPPSPTAEPTTSVDVAETSTPLPTSEPAPELDATDTSDPAPATMLAPASDALAMACSQATGESADSGAVRVTCTISATESLASQEATLTHLDIEPPQGWALSGGEQASGGPMTLTTNALIGPGGSHEVSFLATPLTCDTASAIVTVRSSFTFEGSGPIEGPTADITIGVPQGEALPPLVTATSLAFGRSVSDGSAYSPVTGTLSMTISAPATTGCARASSNWSIKVGTDGLEGPGADVPANAFTYLGAQSSAGAPFGLNPVTTDVQLVQGAPVTIASGNDMVEDGAVWNAVFELRPSHDAPAGAYGGTFSITTVNGE